MITLESVKQTMLDQKRIVDAAEMATFRALSRFGAFVRQRAKTSMRRRKAISDPGEPPSTHLGLIRDNVLFEVERAAKNVVIGPMQLNKSSPMALSALEHGGQTIIMRRGKALEVQVAARPFMQPAFDKELERAPYLWENGLR